MVLLQLENDIANIFYYITKHIFNFFTKLIYIFYVFEYFHVLILLKSNDSIYIKIILKAISKILLHQQHYQLKSQLLNFLVCSCISKHKTTTMADLLGSILSSMEKPPSVGDKEKKLAKGKTNKLKIFKMPPVRETFIKMFCNLLG